MIYQLAHGRMSGERTRQLDYGTIAKTEVAERWFPFSEGIKKWWESSHKIGMIVFIVAILDFSDKL